jgi:ribosomal protein S18 acetylase RimI-like enzyme
MLVVRTLSPEDWPLWRALRLAALAEAPAAFGAALADWQGANDQEARWRARLSIPGGADFVAVVDGEPAGMASGIPTGDPAVVELISMWVAPSARRRGVGRALIATVAAWGVAGGARRLRLAVAPDNPGAQALYHRAGFVDTGDGELMSDGRRRERVLALTLVRT